MTSQKLKDTCPDTKCHFWSRLIKISETIYVGISFEIEHESSNENEKENLQEKSAKIQVTYLQLFGIGHLRVQTNNSIDEQECR